jgi:putative ABC transport system permease protein
MRDLLGDVGYSARTVAKSPGYFAVSVLTLALGIGANTAIFSVINAVLLTPPPFREPDRLVRLYETEAAPGNYPFAGPDYLNWQAQNHTLEATSLFVYRGPANVSGRGEAASAVAFAVEPNFFAVLGVQPLHGRVFGPRDGGPSAARVAIVSFGFWQRQLGGDRAIVGRDIELDSERCTVVGVMPASFTFPRRTDVWTPLDTSLQNLGPRGSHNYWAIARLKPGVSVSQAQADLAVIAARLEKQFPDSNEKVGASVVSMREQMTRGAREPLLILLGAVTLVLLVACANVANLQLVRAGARRREFAIRSALGAGRWRIARQLLAESLLLAVAGASVGLAFAWWGVSVLRSARALPLPAVTPIRIDLSVLLFTASAALVSALLFGVLPALHASAASPGDELKSTSHTAGGTGRRMRRWRDGIAVSQIAVSLALLIGAGLLLRSFDRMRRADIGADARGVLTVGINLPSSSYSTLTARRAFFDRLLDRLRSSPGVGETSVSTRIPVEGGSNGFITVPGQDDARLRNQLFEWNYVSRDYFRAFGIPVLEGRTFTAQDEDRAAEVAAKFVELRGVPNLAPDVLATCSWPAVISREMARLVWPKQDPIGRTFLVGGGLRVEVVGVAGDVKARGIRGEMMPQGYFAFPGALDDAQPAFVAVRNAGDPMLLLPAVRAHVKDLDPTLAVTDPRTMRDVVAEDMVDTTVQTWLLGVFAALGLVLAGVGLYGVMSFLVAQRRREIGIRIALGARPGDVLRLVVRHAGSLVFAGLLIGSLVALWLTRLLRGLLFGVGAHDVPTFAAVSVLIVVVALAASSVPARRATRVDPNVALRCE